MAKKIWLILGILNLVLIIIATIVIVYNKRMTRTDKVWHILWILILPLLSPILTLIEVLSWKAKEESKRKKM